MDLKVVPGWYIPLLRQQQAQQHPPFSLKELERQLISQPNSIVQHPSYPRHKPFPGLLPQLPGLHTSCVCMFAWDEKTLLLSHSHMSCLRISFLVLISCTYWTTQRFKSVFFTEKAISNHKIFLLDTGVGTCINLLLRRSFSLAWLSAQFHHHSETVRKQITIIHKPPREYICILVK